MPKGSSERQVLPEQAAEDMRQFFGPYGAFFQLWQTFDLLVEILIMRELGITPLQGSVVCGGLNFGAKWNILLSLLSLDRKNDDGIKALKDANSIAERNDLTHSFLTHALGKAPMRLVRRFVKDKYSVRMRDVDGDQMKKHGYEFTVAIEKISTSFNITETDIDAYTREIEGHR